MNGTGHGGVVRGAARATTGPAADGGPVAPAAIDIRLLGQVGVWVAGQPVLIRRRQERTVLAVLALDVGRVVAMERLIDLLWPRALPADPRAGLQAMASHLRRALGRSGGRRPVLVSVAGTGYRLDVDPHLVDLHRFRAAVEVARGLVEPRDRALAYDDAVALWQGPALGGVASPDVLAAVAASLEAARQDAQEEGIRAWLAAGEPDAVLDRLVAMVEERSLASRPRALLMTALYRCGRRAEALDCYRQARQVWVGELGLEPDGELRALHAAILADDPGGRGGPGHRSSLRPAELPRDVTPFVGRAEELVQLDRLAAGDDAVVAGPTMLVIAGIAGAGKTSLAVHWAHRARAAFPDGQLFVRLRAHQPGGPVAAKVAVAGCLAALGLDRREIPDHEDHMSALLRTITSSRRLLLLLDDADGEEQVRALLPGTGWSRVLITSRRQLSGLVALDGAARLRLEPLPDEDALALLAGTIGSARVRDEAVAAALLARRCGNLPLALRVAAALVASHPGRTVAGALREMQADPSGRTLALHADPSTAVRAAFDASYRRLSPAAGQLFRLLGVAPVPDLGVPAICALAGLGRDDTRQALDELAAASLVHPVPGDRVTLHDLLRSYAADLHASIDGANRADQARQRLVAYYLSAIDAAARLIYPYRLRLDNRRYGGRTAEESPDVFADEVAAVAWLDAEQANLMQMIRWAATVDPEACWLLADSAGGYLMQSAPAGGWMMALTTALDAATRSRRPDVRCAITLTMGIVNFRAQRYDRTLELARHAATLARQAGWTDGRAAALNQQAIVYDVRGETTTAERLFEQALVLYQRTGREIGCAVQLTNLAELHLATGDLGRARDEAVAALPDAASGRHTTGRAAILTRLGRAQSLLGEVAAARVTLARAMHFGRHNGDRAGMIMACTTLAALHRGAGEPEAAFDALAMASTLNDRLDDARERIELLIEYGLTCLAAGRRPEARDCLRRALDQAITAGLPLAEATALTGLADLDLSDGRGDSAAQVASRAIEIAGRCRFRLIEIDALTIRARAHLDGDDIPKANADARRATRLARATGYRDGLRRIRPVSAGIAGPPA
jgi:DNA-binding SARP family transcriptional activator/tetratricopeptide (TPR) repeat protein